MKQADIRARVYEAREGGVKSSQPSNIDRRDESTFFAQEFLLKGSEA